MCSKRLPGKCLADIQGKPMLQYLLERLERSRELDVIVVATSIEVCDDPIDAFCHSIGIPCFRGDLENVAKRFASTIQAYALEGFVRICGDSPLLDFALVDEAVAVFRRERPDIVTNCMTRSYPPGQSVEVVDASTFLKALPLMGRKEDREHVTTFFKGSQKSFRIRQLSATKNYEGVCLAVDRSEELDLLRRVIGCMKDHHYVYDLDAIVGIYRELLEQVEACGKINAVTPSRVGKAG
jgi:spore coat polysaccharide biosynthesis protein SpsF